MDTRRFGGAPGDEGAEHPTRRLPDRTKPCVACMGVMTPLSFWTSGDNFGWGELRFGPRHPGQMAVPLMQSGGAPTGPVDMAPELKVETFVCTRCGRLDWYVVGPMLGDEGGMR
jgi:hypothetical protein